MTLKKLTFQPGVVKSNSDYAEPGRYIDAQWVRFVGGYPEKMGGWAANTTALLTGLCRRICEWRDNKSSDRAAFGTHKKLYVLENDALTDITPLRGLNTGTLSGAIATTNASATVTITHAAHSQSALDYVTLTAASSVGGLLIAGNYQIQTVPTANTYTITAASAANATTSGGGSIPYTYYRRLLGANPFATTNGSPLVTVTDSATVSEGDTVIFAGATAVAGLTISGSYVVTSAPGTGTYVINAGSNANATTTGGGAVVTVQNELGIGFTDTLVGYGYGAGAYGASTYGTARTSSSITLGLRTWALWAYGEWLLANPRGGALYMWDPNTGGRALILYNAPTQCLSFFVTEERYIVALGKDGDYLKMGWPDQTDPTNWVAAYPTSTANPSRKVQGGNFFQAGAPVRNQISLIWTDTSVFLHQWRTDSYVFTTTKIADKCGLFGPNAYCVIGEVAYWIGGDGQLWKYDGALDLLPADDVLAWFQTHVDRDQRDKVYLGTIGEQNEIIVLYQETGQSEINRYLIYDVADKIYVPGTITRTAWHDRGLYPYPLATDSDGNIWNHEYGVDGNGAAIDAYIVAAPADFLDGDQNADIFGFYPDIKDQVGNLSLYVLTRSNPMDTPTSEGPYTLGTSGAHQDLRSAGSMAGFKIESNVVGGDFRLGVQRVDAQAAGSRRP